MTYRVRAGYVTVQTMVENGRAYIDIPKGAELPGDVPAAEVDWLLRSGQVEETSTRSEQEAEPADELDGLEKADLLKIAADDGIDVDKRWGSERIANTIREHRR